MIVHFLAVWKLLGASNLAIDSPSVTLASITEPNATASITADPEPHFFHIDRAGALATLLFKGLFASEKVGTPEERVAQEVVAIKERRKKQTENGVFLVVHGETKIDPPEFSARRDLDDFAVCLDDIDSSNIRTLFQPFVDSAHAALGLSLKSSASRRVRHLGNVVYLVDDEKNIPIYALKIIGGVGRAFVANSMDESVIRDSAIRVTKLVHDKTTERPTKLINASFDEETDQLQGFISAWSALEIFVNTSFKTRYKSLLLNAEKRDLPVPIRTIRERLVDHGSGKISLAEKFHFIATLVDANTAAAENKQFRDLKTIRDDLLHGLEIPAQLPTEGVQNMLLKYMRFYIDTSPDT